jgi:peroxiredoxin
MYRLYNNLLIFLVLFLSCLSFAKGPVMPSFFKEIEEAFKIENNYVFYDQSMNEKNLENFEDRFIILHFWASWYMNAFNDLAALNNLQKNFRKKSLFVIAVSEDFRSVSFLDEFFTKHKIDYLDIFIDPKSRFSQFLNIKHLPVSYLIDFNGNVIAKSKEGEMLDWSDKTLEAYLDHKVSSYQLLAPEFKKMRDKYEASEQNIEKASNNKKSTLIIN